MKSSVLPSHSVAVAILLLFAVSSAAVSQQFIDPPPKREVRAVWITTASGLDWPKTLDKSEQQASLKRIVQDLHRAHFNTIFFQVRARGDACYKSSYEPWAENLTGVLGQDPGWDPLDVLLREAHAVGMEVHAWFNVYKVRGPIPVGQSVPRHVTIAHPEWAVKVGEEFWLDPGILEARGYLLRVALELARVYDIDGIQLDFIRYPGRGFPDDRTYRRYGYGKDRDVWRRSNIDAFVAEFYEAATQLKPNLKIGSAPVGIYDGIENGDPLGSYHSYYQDSQGWLRRGIQDYLVPQVYWDIGSTKGDPDFAQLANRWAQNSAGRHIYIGIGAYKPSIVRELPTEIDTIRASGAAGQAFFRLESIIPFTLLGDRYRTLADVPPMGWKDSIPPLTPTQLQVSQIGPNVFRLDWVPPAKASDGESVWSYNVYRSSSPIIPFNDPSNLIAILGHATTSYSDTIDTPGSAAYYYAVSALDRGNNESAPSSVTSGIVREMLALTSRLRSVTSLSLSVASQDPVPILIAFHIPERTFVSLDLFKQEEVLVSTVLRGIRDGGTYVVGIRREQLDPGHYLVRLKAADTTLDEPVEVRP